MRYIDEVGMKQVMEEALAGLDADTHLHVSFDVDMLDPSIAPGTGTKVPGGVNYREGQLIMEMIADSGRMGSLDIVEVNPILDAGNATAELAVDLVESLFRSEEHTSELQSLMRLSYAVFCLKKKNIHQQNK